MSLKTCTYPVVVNPDGTCQMCDNICEGKTDFCSSHNRQIRKEAETELKANEKRSQLIKNQQLKSSQPRPKVKPISDKRKELNKEYFTLVEQFKKDNPHCKANVNEYCTKNTDDPHHRRGRGKYLLDVSTWLPVCRSCHIFITANSKEAIQKGWSLSRLSVNQEKEII